MRSRFATVLTAVAALAISQGSGGRAAAQSAAGAFVNFESGHVRPIALSPDGSRLFAVNTPDNRLEIYTVTAGGLTLAGEVPVGLEPVAVAARSNTEVWVVNHLSDSVSIVAIDAATPGAVTRDAHAAHLRRAARHRVRRSERRTRLHHDGAARAELPGSGQPHHQRAGACGGPGVRRR